MEENKMKTVTQLDINVAMVALEEMEDIRIAENTINSQIKDSCKSDFNEYQVTFIHPKLSEQYFSMIKHLLGGSDIAEYYFYECNLMPKGGYIQTAEGKKYRIRYIGDVLLYCDQELRNKPPTINARPEHEEQDDKTND